MTSSSGWSGVFVIPVTPFNPDLSIDLPSFRRQIHFCLDSGVHGIAFPAVVSEFFTLDLEERRTLLEILVEEVGGQVPVIAGVSAPSSPYAAKLARHAATLGCAGVVTMLPYVQHFFAPSTEFAVRHLRMVAAEGLPIMFQNARIGHPVPVGRLPELVEAVPEIVAVKEETSPSTHQLGRAIDALKGHGVDVFGGLGGIFLTDEIVRGAAGTMPAPQYVDLLVDAYTAAVAGEVAQARKLLAACATGFNYELLYNLGVIKEVLVTRGIISHAVARTPSPDMDSVDRAEIEAFLATVNPYLRSGKAPIGPDGSGPTEIRRGGS